MQPAIIVIETGSRKAFAAALGWPGWCRSGKTEEAALQVLLDYAQRYADVLAGSGIAFELPTEAAQLVVTEHLKGSATTDFGAPAGIAAADHETLDPAALNHLSAILQACWRAFDRAVEQAEGRTLRKGPRGGGRDTAKIITHLIESDYAYLGKLGWKHRLERGNTPAQKLRRIREAVQEALQAAADGTLPQKGPRGGSLWPARYFVRRAAWHVLDHAWEIEDRLEN